MLLLSSSPPWRTGYNKLRYELPSYGFWVGFGGIWGLGFRLRVQSRDIWGFSIIRGSLCGGVLERQGFTFLQFAGKGPSSKP